MKKYMASIPYISKYPVVAFFALTFIISWGAIGLIFGSEGIPATEDTQEKVGMAILLGPVMASLLLTGLLDGSKGLRQLGAKLLRWRAVIKWYALALLIAPLSTLTTIFVLSLFTPTYHPAILTSPDPSALLLLGIIGGLAIGFCEELGWSGFAVPRLIKRHSIFTTGIMVGLLWGAWHFILFWEEDSFSQRLPFFLLFARLFAWLPAYRILMVWVYEGTQSLLIIVLMHASLVASLATLDPAITGESLLAYIVIRALILWAVVVVLAIIRSKI